MATTKTLKLTFKTDQNKEHSISLDDPKDDLKADDVSAVMNEIVTKEFLVPSAGNLVSVVGASIIEKVTTELM